MNPPAIELYREHGIDLERERLEIAVCAQHNNGGLKGEHLVGIQRSAGLFPVGEVNGTHGVYRPGGVGPQRRPGRQPAGRPVHRRAADEPASRRRIPRPWPEADRRDDGHRPADWSIPGSEGRPGSTAAVTELRPACPRPAPTSATRGRSGTRSEPPGPFGSGCGRTPASGARRPICPPRFKALDLALTHAVYLEAIKEYLLRGGTEPRLLPCSRSGRGEALPRPWGRWSFKPPRRRPGKGPSSRSPTPAGRNAEKHWTRRPARSQGRSLVRDRLGRLPEDRIVR